MSYHPFFIEQSLGIPLLPVPKEECPEHAAIDIKIVFAELIHSFDSDRALEKYPTHDAVLKKYAKEEYPEVLTDTHKSVILVRIIRSIVKANHDIFKELILEYVTSSMNFKSFKEKFFEKAESEGFVQQMKYVLTELSNTIKVEETDYTERVIEFCMIDLRYVSDPEAKKPLVKRNLLYIHHGTKCQGLPHSHYVDFVNGLYQFIQDAHSGKFIRKNKTEPLLNCKDMLRAADYVRSMLNDGEYIQGSAVKEVMKLIDFAYEAGWYDKYINEFYQVMSYEPLRILQAVLHMDDIGDFAIGFYPH